MGQKQFKENKLKMTDGEYKMVLLLSADNNGKFPSFHIGKKKLYSAGTFDRKSSRSWDNLPILPKEVGIEYNLPLDPTFHK